MITPEKFGKEIVIEEAFKEGAELMGSQGIKNLSMATYNSAMSQKDGIDCMTHLDDEGNFYFLSVPSKKF